MRIFSTTKSPGCGSSPRTGAAPQVPRTIALLSTRPSNSGAFSVMPGAPGSTTNQTWITITPRARAASARRRMFSTTFCCFACAGEPEEANAPPSMITSFCMSWMIIAQRDGSSRSAAVGASTVGARGALADVAPPRLRMYGSMRGPTLVLHRVDRVRRGHEQRVEIRRRPRQIGHQLGHAHLAEQAAGRRIDPHAARRRDPDVALRVALHAVRHAGLELGADAAREHAAGARASRRRSRRTPRSCRSPCR